MDDGFVELLKRRRVTYVPTLMVVERYRQTLSHTLRLTAHELRWADPWVLATLFDPFENRPRPASPAGAANLKRLHDAGVPIAAGTDAGNIGTPHGPAIFRELEMMVEAGLTPSQALASATHGGDLAPGSPADLVLLGSDPAADIRNLADIRLVVKDGHAWRPKEILSESPVDLVQRQVNAYNARHLDAFLETYADDVEIDGLLQLRGKAAMRDRYGRLFDGNPGLHCEIVRRQVVDNVIVDDERVTGRADGVERRARARYVVEGGLIRRVTFLPLE